jgi:hypothetical protein
MTKIINEVQTFGAASAHFRKLFSVSENDTASFPGTNKQKEKGCVSPVVRDDVKPTPEPVGNDYRAYNYSITLNRLLFKGELELFKEGVQCSGLINHAKDHVKKLDKHYVKSQIAYLVYNNSGYVGSRLHEIVADSGEEFVNHDYNGFSNGSFEGFFDDENDATYEKLMNQNDFVNEVTNLIKLKTAMKYFNVQGNLFEIIALSEVLKTNNLVRDGGITSSVSLHHINKITKPDELAFYQAIKSIVGKQKCAKTNKKMILARALGYELVSEAEAHPLFAVYAKSDFYKLDKIIEALVDNWGVKVAWCGRGMAVATKASVSQRKLIEWAAGKLSRVPKDGSRSHVLAIKRELQKNSGI